MYFRLHWLGIEAHAYAHYTSLLCFALVCEVRNTHINKKHRLWTRYLETRNPTVLLQYKKARNIVKMEARKIHKFKQESIAKLTKSNPKHFWKYIKSKTSININVSELKSMDSNDKDKVMIYVIKSNILG